MKICSSYVAMTYREACKAIRKSYKGLGFRPVIDKCYSLITGPDYITLQVHYTGSDGINQNYNTAM